MLLLLIDKKEFSLLYFRNVSIDDPRNIDCRWTSDFHTRPQFIYLRLRHPAFVRRIQIGKATSIANSVKRLRVYGGADEENLNLILDM